MDSVQSEMKQQKYNEMKYYSPFAIRILIRVYPAFLLAWLLNYPLGAASWQPAAGPLQTRWAKDVSPQNPHPEYPRPQMTRKDWLNLNGLWDLAITAKDDPK